MSGKYIKSGKVSRKSVIPMVLEVTAFLKSSHKTACIYKKSKNLIKNQKNNTLWRQKIRAFGGFCFIKDIEKNQLRQLGKLRELLFLRNIINKSCSPFRWR